MPTILFLKGYRFFWYSVDLTEPIHIHVRKENCKVKFWCDPVKMAKNEGFAPHELKEIRDMIEENIDLIKEKWNG